MQYVIKYVNLPNNLLIVQIEINGKTIIYVNTNKKDSPLGKVNYQMYRK